MLALVHQRREFGPAGPELVGDLPPGMMGGIGVGLEDGLPQRGRDGCATPYPTCRKPSRAWLRPLCAKRSSSPIVQRQPDPAPRRRPVADEVAKARRVHRRQRGQRAGASGLPDPAPQQDPQHPRPPPPNPLERLNKEVKRRADVVGIFPNEGAIVRLIGAVLLEANDEWALQHRYMQTEAMAELTPPLPDPVPTQISSRSRMIHGHLSHTPTFTTLTDVISWPTRLWSSRSVWSGSRQHSN